MKQVNNGFKECYLIDKQGKIYNKATEKYLKLDKNSYILTTKEGKRKSITQKELYKLVYNKPFCIDDIELLDGEVFKEIRDTDGNYYVSNKGRVKSYVGYKAIIMKPSLTKSGYYRLQIIQNGQLVNRFVHTLVANEWLEIPNELELEIHHKDFCRVHNEVDNLEVLTKAQHREKHQKRKEQIKDA